MFNLKKIQGRLTGKSVKAIPVKTRKRESPVCTQINDSVTLFNNNNNNNNI